MEYKSMGFNVPKYLYLRMLRHRVDTGETMNALVVRLVKQEFGYLDEEEPKEDRDERRDR